MAERTVINATSGDFVAPPDEFAPVERTNPFPPLEPSELPALFERPGFRELPYEKRREALSNALSAVYDFTSAQPDFEDVHSSQFGQLATRAYAKLDEEHTLGEKTGEFGKTLWEFGKGMVKDIGAAGVAAASLGMRAQAAIDPTGRSKDLTQGASQAFGYGFGVGSARYIDAFNHIQDKWASDSHGELKESLAGVRGEIDAGKAPLNDPAAFTGWLRDQSARTLVPQNKWTAFRLGDYGVNDPQVAFGLADANQLAAPQNAGLVAAYIKSRDPHIWEQLEKNLATTPLAAALGDEAKAVTQSESGKWMDSTFGKGASEHLLSTSDPLMVAGYLIPGARAAALGKAVAKAEGGITARAAIAGKGMAAGLPEQAALGGAMTVGHDPEATAGEVAAGAGTMMAAGAVMHGAGVAVGEGVRGVRAARERFAPPPPGDNGPYAPSEPPIPPTEPAAPTIQPQDRAGIEAAPTPEVRGIVEEVVGRAAETRNPADPAPVNLTDVRPAEAEPGPPGAVPPPEPGPPGSTAALEPPPPAAEPTAAPPATRITPEEASTEPVGIAPDATSNKEAVVNLEREQRGLDPAAKDAPIANADLLQQGRAVIEAEPNAAENIAARLRTATPEQRSISREDAAVLGAERVKLQTERDAQVAIIADETRPEVEKGVARTRWEELETKINTLDQAAQDSRSVWGGWGNFWQQLIKQDFTFEALERKARVSKDRPLTAEESATIKTQAETHAAEGAKAEAARKEVEELAGARKRIGVLEELLKAAGQPRAGPKVTAATTHVQKSPLAAGVTAFLDDQAAKAMARIVERRSKLSVTVDPGLAALADEAIIGAAKLGKGAIKFADWSAQMLSEVGDYIKPQLAALWKMSKARLAEMVKEAPRDIDGERASTIAGMKQRLAEGDGPEDLHRYARELARQHIAQGITELDPLTEAVHTSLKEVIPDITGMEARDAWSGFGRWTPLDKAPEKVVLRQRSAEAQAVSKIELYEKGRPAPKTGVERELPTEAKRALEKRAAKLAKEMGIEVVDPATQLKSSLDAIKTRLKNEIADMDFAMSKNTRIAKRPGVDYDTDAQALKAARDAKKAEYDAVFPKESITAAEQLRRAEVLAQRNLEQWQKKLVDAKAGKFPRAEGPLEGPKSRRLQELDEQTKAAGAEVDLLRSLDSALAETRQQDALKRANETLQLRLDEGEKEAAAPVAGADSAEVTALKERNAALRADIAEGSTVRALERAIADADRKISEGDLFTRATPPREVSTRVEQLRAERDAMNQLLRELRAEARPRRSDAEISLKARRSRALHRITELARRRREKDFSPMKKAPIEGPKTLAETSAQKRLETALVAQKKVERAFAEDRLKDRLGKRTQWAKAKDTAAEVFHTFRAIMTGGEFSGVLRQGKFAVASHPITTFRGAFPAMLRAFRSVDKETAEMVKIESRPNATLYKQVGLAINDPNSFTAAQLEGNYRSRTANRIPFIAGSGRAYTTFTNRLRADVFDLLVDKMSRGGEAITLERMKIIAQYVNEMTGSGGLGVKGQKAAEILNYTFFSPKFVMSRFQMALGHSLWGGDRVTRRIIAEEYARVLLGMGAIYSLYGLMRENPIEDDARSSDFGKINIGNTKLDPMAGVLQATVFMARTASGQTTDREGSVTAIRRTDDAKIPFGKDNWSKVAMKFARSKLAPIPGAFVDQLNGENFKGDPVTIGGQLINIGTPMTWGDIYDAIREQGAPKGVALSMLAFFGESVNTYNREEEKARKAAAKKEAAKK